MGERATVITVGLQKGGVGKSTTTGALAYMLSEDGYKVLVVDMDSQGNVSDLLTQQDVEFYEGKTVLEAMLEWDIEPYIYEVNEKIHIVPSDDYLATLAKKLYTSDEMKHLKNKDLALKGILEPVLHNYDFVIIDTPPSLSEPMINAICASDYVLVMAQSSKWSFNAVSRFLATVYHAEENVNPGLKVAGILRVLNDSRRADSKAFSEVVEEMWPDLCFETVIKQRASTGRLSMDGFTDNKELSPALEQYKDFYKELKERVGI